MKKKIVLGIAAAGSALALLPMFAAFEAHVINVTAQIENALAVTTDKIDFGTVFPQEHLEKPLDISLSSSFLAEERVDDIEYFIRQKPKCGVTSDEGTVLVGPTWTGHVIPDLTTTSTTSDYIIDCEADRPDEVEAQPQDLDFYLLPDLCPYISKEGEDQNDETTPSFHHPFTVADNVINWLDTNGRLAKSDDDTVDHWVIDLSVPCFGGFCAQDWNDFVHRINPEANPDEFTQPIANEHKIFGCNLWVEVTGVSEEVPPPPPPPAPTEPLVGANLSAYVQPTVECDAFVDDSFVAPVAPNFSTIQAAINDAGTVNGGTVCVAAGTYGEDVTVNKEITLSGAGPTSIINGQTLGFGGTVAISSDNVILEGFAINGIGGANDTAVYLTTNNSGITVRFNTITSGSALANAFLTDGGQSNHTISNNVFAGSSAQLVYVNGFADVGNVSTNVDFTNNDFDGTATGPLLGINADNSAITKNDFNGSPGSNAAGTFEDTNVFNQNNFTSTALIELGNADTGTLNAENNWWGDAAPADNVSGDVDFTPFEFGPFPEN